MPDDPFRVAVLEIRDGATVRAVRCVLGDEPTDAELYELLLHQGGALLARAAAAVAAEAAVAAPGGKTPVTARNPKRLARTAAREARRARPSTAAQEAVKRDVEQRAAAASERTKAVRDEHAEHRRGVRREGPSAPPGALAPQGH